MLTGLVISLVSIAPCFFLEVEQGSPVLYLAYGFVVGILLLSVGVVAAMQDSRYKAQFAQTLGGLDLTGGSALLFLWVVSSDVTGVAIIGFIPIPLVAIPIGTLLVGVLMLLAGVTGFRK